MSAAVAPTFRLLDGRVGWDPAEEDGLSGLVLSDGVLTLAPVAAVGPDPARWPAGRVSRGLGCCTWWMLGEPASSGPGQPRRQLLRLGDCDDRFMPIGNGAAFEDPRAVSANDDHVVVLDGDRVIILAGPDWRLVGEAVVPGATAVALRSDGRLLAGDDRGRVHELDLSGLICRTVATPGCRPVDALAFSADPAGTVVVLHADGTISLYRGAEVSWGGPEHLGALPDTGVLVLTDQGFCLVGRGCFDWAGNPLASDDIGPGPIRFVIRGQLLTARLDSGIARCRWHRVRVDADVPDGTEVRVGFATTDDPDERPSRLQAGGEWETFTAGPPHPSDWQDGPPGRLDFLISTPPGRYAFVRIRLLGTGVDSPAVHRVRIDFPRSTSMDRLPAAYAENPTAAEFTERFLSLFDAELEDVDEALRRRPALLDPTALPDDALPWLAGFLGLGFEATMSSDQRRAFLALAPDLFRRRGTPSGLVDTLRAALGVEVTIEELGRQRPWGALGAGARLGAVRLFGRSTARVRLGATALGTAPLDSLGNPDDDARRSGAHRFRVHVAPTSVDPDLVRRVVRSQSPAPTAPRVHFSTGEFRVGALRVGIDTTFMPPRPAVLNSVRLGRGGVLRPVRIGRPRVVGALVVHRSTRTE